MGVFLRFRASDATRFLSILSQTRARAPRRHALGQRFPATPCCGAHRLRHGIAVQAMVHYDHWRFAGDPSTWSWPGSSPPDLIREPFDALSCPLFLCACGGGKGEARRGYPRRWGPRRMTRRGTLRGHAGKDSEGTMYSNVNLFIEGAWRPAIGGKTLSVLNPATGEEIGTVAHAEKADLDLALAAAQKGFETWRKVSAHERYRLMRKAADILRSRAGDIATLMTMEQGKPLAESKGETLGGADVIDWLAEEGGRT